MFKNISRRCVPLGQSSQLLEFLKINCTFAYNTIVKVVNVRVMNKITTNTNIKKKSHD